MYKMIFWFLSFLLLEFIDFNVVNYGVFNKKLVGIGSGSMDDS